MTSLTVALSTFAGPGLHAPFAAVAATLREVPPNRLPAAQVVAALAGLVPATLRQRLVPQTSLTALDLVEAAALLAARLQDFHGALDRPCAITRHPDGSACILLGYRDARAATRALQAACTTTAALWRAADGAAVDVAAVASSLQRSLEVLHHLHPDHIARALMHAAELRDIPVYAVTSTRVWQYGQGRSGCQFFEAATHHDALIGGRIARDKLASNELITSLGLPGVRHFLARDVGDARRAAALLGYPLVVKPLDGSHGRGVTTGIMDDAALLAAFALACAVEGSSGKVLVERQVSGNDYRISVIGGHFTWAVWRRAPRVTGDGEHTVAELIAEENRRRAGPALDAGHIKRLVLDQDMHAMLARQGVAADEVLPAGREITLRNVHNTSAGGLPLDVTAEVHADNRALAETVARVFHLDACGIDFMSPDITRSWREVECAVLEVNSTPGFAQADRAVLILARKFPPPAQGRIPSVLLVDAAESLAQAAAATLARRGHMVGLTTLATTSLGAERRCLGHHALPARVLALLLDPATSALVIAASTAELTAHGLPLDRLSVAAIAPGADLSPALRAVIDGRAGHLIEGAGPQDFAVRLATELATCIEPA